MWSRYYAGQVPERITHKPQGTPDALLPDPESYRRHTYDPRGRLAPDLQQIGIKFVYPLLRSSVVRNTTGVWRSLAAAQAFIVSKDENLVLDYRPADRHARTDSVAVRLFGSVATRLKIVGSVQLIVAEKFPPVP